MAELKNPITDEIAPQPKRGRPSKSAPVYVDNVMVLSGEEHERINELVTGIAADTEKIQRLAISTAERYFELGGIIDEAIRRAPASKAVTKADVERWTRIPAGKVTVALKVYHRFKEKEEYLKNLTMKDVYQLIGDRQENGRKETERMQYFLPREPELFDKEFGLPPLSGVDLKKYRVQADVSQGKLWILNKNYGHAIPAASITVEQPKNTVQEDAYNKFMADTQIALERYYLVLENSGEDEDDTVA